MNLLFMEILQLEVFYTVTVQSETKIAQMEKKNKTSLFWVGESMKVKKRGKCYLYNIKSETYNGIFPIILVRVNFDLRLSTWDYL